MQLDVQDSITLTEFIPDEERFSLYSRSECFIMESIAELQSIATIEVIASGLPVIASNAAALPELIHHAVNGFYVAHEM